MQTLRTILAVLVAHLMIAFASAQDAAAVTKGLDQWLKAYRANKIARGSRAEIGPNSIGRKSGALPKGLLGLLTAYREIEGMLDAAAKNESEGVLLAVLGVAAVEQDDVRYKPEAMAHSVRLLGEAALAHFTSEGSRTTLEKVVAEGAKGAPKGVAAGMQAAALRALATSGIESARSLARGAMENPDPDVRTAAADALGKRGTADDIGALTKALEAEREGNPLAALGMALLGIVQREKANLDQPTRDAVASAVAAALGRSEWRVDMVLVDLAEATRSTKAIPALIDVLQRFVADSKAVRSGALSGVLRYRAHEALLSLTGAAFPMEDPAKWREFWEKNSATLTVSPEPAARPAGATSSGFFGIPVRGTRVVFIVDLSGSMTAHIRPLNKTASEGEYTSRLAVAQEQAWDSIQHLEEDAMFDIVAFNQEPMTWQGKLVPATEANKKKAKKFIDEFQAKGGTNLWGGLMKALEFAPGSNAAKNELALDEIFLLSDGAPTVGEILDPREILRLVKDANATKRVRINTVFLQGEGSIDMDPQTKAGEMGPADLMENLAKDSGGSYVKR